MAINRRMSTRKLQQLEVDVYNSGTFLGRARTRDVHNDGAFILIKGYPGEFFQNDALELHFIPDEKQQKPIRMNGMVIRKSSEGVAVQFNYGQSEFRNLFKTFFRNIGAVGKNERLLQQHLSSHSSI